MRKNCWLIGAGYMAEEYIKVLKEFSVNLTVIGRGVDRAEDLKKRFELNVFSGGISYFLDTNPHLPEYAIIAVSCEELYLVTKLLINVGVKNILVEKPAGLNHVEITDLVKCAEFNQINVFVAYNRRFYNSVDLLKNQIEADGGALSAQFEFTEWIHTIDTIKFPSSVLSKFIIANSSHVLDTVFYLVGKPREFSFFVGGNSVDWHPSGSIFVGSGVSEKNVYFSYSSNWGSAGRWSIEILTSKCRYFLKPLEVLYYQNIGSVEVVKFDGDYQIDESFKPGLYKMVSAFIDEKVSSQLCTIGEHDSNFKFYNLISSY
jgi:predicted dehydrogenase